MHLRRRATPARAHESTTSVLEVRMRILIILPSPSFQRMCKLCIVPDQIVEVLKMLFINVKKKKIPRKL